MLIVNKNEQMLYCEIILDKDLIKVIPTPMRPFQGWRYYMEEDIPPDLNTNDDGSEEIPDEVNSELIKLFLFESYSTSITPPSIGYNEEFI